MPVDSLMPAHSSELLPSGKPFDRPLQEVNRFMDSHGWRGLVERLLKAVEEIYPADSDVRLSIEGDPETEGRWLVIDMTTNSGVDQSLRWHDELVDKWIQIAPPAESQLVRLTFNFA